MYGELFALYNRCFPNYQTTPAWFDTLLAPQAAHIIYMRNDDGALIGFSLIHGSSIALLCVDESYRNKGYGSKLLEQSETFINTTGAEKIVLGDGAHYILQGVPVDESRRAADFFTKRGYSASWESVNMRLRLDEFDLDRLSIPEVPQNVSFRLAEESDREALIRAVCDAEPDWKGIFVYSTDPVLLAMQYGEIVGFQILSSNGGRFLPNDSVGFIGCVGIVHKARKQGIGLRMVAEGAERLKALGCEAIELLYIYHVDWYTRLGCEVTGRQWMGEKIL